MTRRCRVISKLTDDGVFFFAYFFGCCLDQLVISLDFVICDFILHGCRSSPGHLHRPKPYLTFVYCIKFLATFCMLMLLIIIKKKTERREPKKVH